MPQIDALYQPEFPRSGRSSTLIAPETGEILSIGSFSYRTTMLLSGDETRSPGFRVRLIIVVPTFAGCFCRLDPLAVLPILHMPIAEIHVRTSAVNRPHRVIPYTIVCYPRCFWVQQRRVVHCFRIAIRDRDHLSGRAHLEFRCPKNGARITVLAMHPDPARSQPQVLHIARNPACAFYVVTIPGNVSPTAIAAPYQRGLPLLGHGRTREYG